MEDFNKPVIALDLPRCGVTVHVTPPSTFLIRAIMEESEKQFPEPDVSDLMAEIPTADGGSDSYLPDENRGEARKRLEAVLIERKKWVDVQNVVLNVKPANGTLESLRAAYGARVKELRKVLSTLPKDEWELLLLYVVMQFDDDSKLIQQALAQSVPLTAGEVVRAMRVFRLDLPGEAD